MSEKKTPKQKVVASMERPFELVSKDKRRSPLRENHPTRCDHNRAYKSDSYPTSGPTFVCADCGFKSSYPEDLQRD